jgi:hypothetical protein
MTIKLIIETDENISDEEIKIYVDALSFYYAIDNIRTNLSRFLRGKEPLMGTSRYLDQYEDVKGIEAIERLLNEAFE